MLKSHCRSPYERVDYGHKEQIEYDFLVSPGADTRPIRLQFSGVKGLELDQDGDLMLTSPSGTLGLRRPTVYQEVDGARKTIDGRFKLVAKNTVGFSLGRYDHAQPLVIDPVLVY